MKLKGLSEAAISRIGKNLFRAPKTSRRVRSQEEAPIFDWWTSEKLEEFLGQFSELQEGDSHQELVQKAKMKWNELMGEEDVDESQPWSAF